jgi:peptide/nickel transport system permease protein
MKNDENNLKESVFEDEHLSSSVALDDEQRIKVLSPSLLVVKRFFRNKLAIVGLVIISSMFVFSFIGGWVSPYQQDQVFQGYSNMSNDYAAVTINTEYRYTEAKTGSLPDLARAMLILALNNGQTVFDYNGVNYKLIKEGDQFYRITSGNTDIAIASMKIFDAESKDTVLSYGFKFLAEKAIQPGNAPTFTFGGKTFTAETINGAASIYQISGKTRTLYSNISNFVVQPVSDDVFLSINFKAAIQKAVKQDAGSFTYTNGNGIKEQYTINRKDNQFLVKSITSTYLIKIYEGPSKSHLLGTDANGMDIMTRLMYGGRISLIIGFIVILLENSIGVVLGGLSGYFGRWVDNLLMRLVDIFNCIPQIPLLIILGAIMDSTGINPQMRIYYLMLILGLLYWPGTARMVRGQILSLREQEFMTATEATGLTVSRRIFKHLVPNVIPQLIVLATMGLGDIILMESTLSFLGLGVKFPFASWGNIISAVSNVYVMTNYWFVWIPAGFLILMTVLGFNFIGDGLRDAFDPKMKR